jgi:hypothetical protein
VKQHLGSHSIEIDFKPETTMKLHLKQDVAHLRGQGTKKLYLWCDSKLSQSRVDCVSREKILGPPANFPIHTGVLKESVGVS